MSNINYSVLTIADEILRIAKSCDDSVRPLKLMKLTYIAFGWYIANRGQSLFKENIEAWKYGPVIPELYQATKKYGRNTIPLELINIAEIATDSDTREFLEAVYEKYGDKTGIYLSNLTHKIGTPWEKVFDSNLRSNEISVALIQQHYKNELEPHDG